MCDLAGVWGLCVLQEHEVHVGGWRGVGDTWRLLCWLLFAPAVPEGPCWAAQVGIVGVKAHLEKAVPVHERRTDNSYIVSQGLGAHERVNWPTFLTSMEGGLLLYSAPEILLRTLKAA